LPEVLHSLPEPFVLPIPPPNPPGTHAAMPLRNLDPAPGTFYLFLRFKWKSQSRVAFHPDQPDSRVTTCKTERTINNNVHANNFPMKLLNLLAPILFAITAQAGDLAKLFLPGKTFGTDWELTPPPYVWNAATLCYTNGKLPNQRTVLVNIREFSTPEAARAQWEKKFGGPQAATLVEKVEGIPDAYDNIPPEEMKQIPHLKRFILIGNYWLTVEQVSVTDDRKVFIEKYYEHIKKHAAGTAPSQ
jgi:hypothetical protein